MAWRRIEQKWRDLRGRLADLTGLFAEARPPERPNDPLPDSLCRRYGINKHERGKRYHEWLREPGALDDWNDRRSI